MAVSASVLPRRRMGGDVLVVGLGNTLLGDDGVGVHVVRYLANSPDVPDGVSALDGGTLGFRLMDTVIQSDAALFIDAADIFEPAGTVRLLERDDLSAYMRRAGRRSAHEAGLIDLLTMLRLGGWSPAHLAVLGVQPARIDWQAHLSDEVARAVPAACSAAASIALRWQQVA